MQDVYFPDSYLYDGKANKEWTLDQLMKRHIVTYSEYLSVYKTLAVAMKGGAKFTFITISARSDVKLKKFVKKVAWFCERKYVDKYFYVFEQRSENDQEVYGIHCHIVASYRKMLVLSQFEQNVSRTFAEFATDKAIFMNHIIDEFISDKVDYVLGDKMDKKLGKVSKDRIWRNQTSLQDYYTNDFNFFVEDGKGRPHKTSSCQEKRSKGDESDDSKGDARNKRNQNSRPDDNY